jgi:2'-hydroxyisoflavone reductase
MESSRRRHMQLSLAALAALSLGRASLATSAKASGPGKRLQILILGGTGFIGPPQVSYALARGHTVTVFNRGKNSESLPKGVEELIGDRSTGDLKSLKGRSWDVCIDNPTTLPSWVRDAGAVLAGKVRQYIFISTVSAYAQNDKPEDESAPLAIYEGKDAMAETQESSRSSPTLYGSLKALSEREANRCFPGATTIIRPGLIVGPGDPTDRFTYWPVRLSRGGEVAAPGDGTDPVQFIDVRDLSEWIIRLAESHTVGTFNATGPADPLNMREMLQVVGAAIHSTARLTWVSSEFLDAQDVSAWRDMPVWVPGSGDSAGFARRDISKAKAAGLTYRALADTAVDTLAWFQQQPAERQAQMKAGLTAERERKLLELWKAQPSPPAK